MSINFSTNDSDIQAAYREVMNGSSATNWAIFTYELGNTLKFAESGEELEGEFEGSKIQYAFARVVEPTSQLPKFVLISWCGDGVQVARKGLFNIHVLEAANYFKGFHVHINARSDEDIEPAAIMKKVKDSSGAKYSVQANVPNPSIGKPAPKIPSYQPPSYIPAKPFDPSQVPNQVPEAYQPIRTNPKPLARQESVKKESKPLTRQESVKKDVKLSYQPISPLTVRANEPAKSFNPIKTVPKPLYGSGVATQVYSTPSKSPYGSAESLSSGQRGSVIGQRPSVIDKAKSDKLEERQRQEQKMADQRRQEALEVNAVKEETKTEEISLKLRMEQVRIREDTRPPTIKKYEQKQYQNNPTFDTPKVLENQYQNTSTYDNPKVVEMQYQSNPKVVENQYQNTPKVVEYQNTPKVVEKQYQNTPTYETSKVVESQFVMPNIIAKESKVAKESAIALYDYESSESNEISLREGETITEIERVDAGWWSGTNTAGKHGFFPADYVQLNEFGAAVKVSQKAEALYDYDATEENELSFRIGDLLVDIEFVTEDWWSGSHSSGAAGLFPASYVAIRK